MNVKKSTLLLFTGFSIAIAGCHSSQQLMEPKVVTKQVEDIDRLEEIGLSTRQVNVGIFDLKHAAPLQQKYATILGVLPHAIHNIDLYNFVEEWYGVRYRLGGDSKKGIDCSAFARRLYENVFCVNLVRTACEQFNMCRFITTNDSVKEGDLVFFKTKGSRISHVGIYLMNDFFVHASSSQGVMISSLNEDYWGKRYAGAGIINKDDLKM